MLFPDGPLPRLWLTRPVTRQDLGIVVIETPKYVVAVHVDDLYP